MGLKLFSTIAYDYDQISEPAQDVCLTRKVQIVGLQDSIDQNSDSFATGSNPRDGQIPARM